MHNVQTCSINKRNCIICILGAVMMRGFVNESKQDSDRIASTNGVVGGIKVALEAFLILRALMKQKKRNST